MLKMTIVKGLYISFVAGMKRYISILLLTVFAIAVLPAPALHEWFADHTDAAENHCRFYHKDLGCHIEKQQEHCDLFKTQTPLYDAAKVQPDLGLFCIVEHAYHSGPVSCLRFSPAHHLPSRAPPVA